MSNKLKDLWSEDPGSRITHLRLKKDLQEKIFTSSGVPKLHRGATLEFAYSTTS